MRSQSLGLDQGLREKREGAEHHDSCAETPTGGETETGKGEGGGSALAKEELRKQNDDLEAEARGLKRRQTHLKLQCEEKLEKVEQVSKKKAYFCEKGQKVNGGLLRLSSTTRVTS